MLSDRFDNQDVQCLLRGTNWVSLQRFFFSPQQTDNFRFAFKPVAMLVTSPVSELHVFRVLCTSLFFLAVKRPTIRFGSLFYLIVQYDRTILSVSSLLTQNVTTILHCFTITLQFQHIWRHYLINCTIF